MSRGIYLVANQKSQDECLNLIYSIRSCGCRLPIHVIPYGGRLFQPDGSADGVQVLSLSDFPHEGIAFVDELRKRIPQCSLGFLRRFLAWFGEFDEFLYSDNDIVALMNWEEIFPHLDRYEFVHADREFITGGIFNFHQPTRFEELLGPGALDLAVTAGHYLCRRSSRQVDDLLTGLAWMEAHPDVVKWHDQTLLHVTLAIAKWPVLNLCKAPYNWGCPWAGSYRNLLDVFRTIQVARQPISHLHYAGGVGTGANPLDEMLFARLSSAQRRRRLLRILAHETSGMAALQRLTDKAKRKAVRLARRER